MEFLILAGGIVLGNILTLYWIAYLLRKGRIDKVYKICEVKFPTKEDKK